MPLRYEKIKKFYLFKNDGKVSPMGKKLPDFDNGKVVFDADILSGRYSFSGWSFEDSGNISVTMERVTESEENNSGGGFDA